jgi:hypothetical protein
MDSLKTNYKKFFSWRRFAGAKTNIVFPHAGLLGQKQTGVFLPQMYGVLSGYFL